MMRPAGPKTSSGSCDGVCCAASTECTFDYGSGPDYDSLCCEKFPSSSRPPADVCTHISDVMDGLVTTHVAGWFVEHTFSVWRRT